MVQIKKRTPEEFRSYIASQKGQHIPICVRIRFRKVGPLAYISHLDLVRTMTKIVVRSSLPLWYTEGFNPKPKLVFAAPLSIGVESEVEFMDLRLSEIVPESEVVEKINRAMPPDMQVLDAYYPVAPLSSLGFIMYKITVSSPDITPDLLQKVEEALTEENIVVEKKTKSGDRCLVNIKEQIHKVDCAISDGKLLLLATLSAAPSSFLNPEYLLTYLRARAGLLSRENLMEESYTVLRLAAYDKELLPFV